MPGEPRAPSARFGHPDLGRALAVLFAGILFCLNCYLVPAFPRAFMLFFSGSEAAFIWAPPAGILLGAGCWLLGRALKREKSKPEDIRLSIVLVVGSALTIFMFVVEPLGTAQFYLLTLFLFPCASLVYGAMAGRLWAVALGALLQLLLGLGTGLDAQDLPQLLAYALVYLAALELSWSSASTTAALARELGEAADDRQRLRVRRTMDRAARNGLGRLAACLAAAAMSVGIALVVYGNPVLFGPAYSESFEAYTVVGLVLPGAAVLGILAVGSLVPPDLGARARKLSAWTRRLARNLVAPVRPRSEEEEPETL